MKEQEKCSVFKATAMSVWHRKKGSNLVAVIREQRKKIVRSKTEGKMKENEKEITTEGKQDIKGQMEQIK